MDSEKESKEKAEERMKRKTSKAREDKIKRPGFNDLMLWGDMKIMFYPDENGEILKNHNSQELIEWKLYEFCKVHSLMLIEVTIYMLVGKKYSLPQDTLTRMLRWKLHVNYEILEMAYELLKFISLGEDCWELKGFYKFILLEGRSAAIED
ncbi:hypothetical protein Tco_0431161 [Tanacetum coccineum]